MRFFGIMLFIIFSTNHSWGQQALAEQAEVLLKAPSAPAITLGQPRCDSNGTIYIRPYNPSEGSPFILRYDKSGSQLAALQIPPALYRMNNINDYTVDNQGTTYLV